MRTVLIELTAEQIAMHHTSDGPIRSLIADLALFRSDSGDLIDGHDPVALMSLV
jgi:hypothetical protein